MTVRVVLNNNPEEVKTIREAIKANDGYCPCAVDKNADTLCMCKDFREMDHSGFCTCGLYQKIIE